jgi:hypothetical protein
MVRLIACCAAEVILHQIKLDPTTPSNQPHNKPVCFVENNYLVLSWRQSNFLLGEHFYFVSDYVDSAATGEDNQQRRLKMGDIGHGERLPFI